MKRLLPVATLGALALCGVALVYADGPQSGDVAGGRVIGLRGYPIAAQNPTDGQVLTYSANAKAYVPGTQTVGGTGFSGMTAGQLPVAASATTGTSSIPVSAVSGNNTVVETGSGGKIASGFMTNVLACADLTDEAATCNTLPTMTLPLTWIPGINPNNLPLAQINATHTVTGIRCRPEVAAGGAATVTVVKAASGTAISAGTPLHSGSCNANGTAATDQILTVTVPALAAGDTIGVITTGTTVWTSAGVATGVVTVYMQ